MLLLFFQQKPTPTTVSFWHSADLFYDPTVIQQVIEMTSVILLGTRYNLAVFHCEESMLHFERPRQAISVVPELPVTEAFCLLFIDVTRCVVKPTLSFFFRVTVEGHSPRIRASALSSERPSLKPPHWPGNRPRASLRSRAHGHSSDASIHPVHRIRA